MKSLTEIIKYDIQSMPFLPKENVWIRATGIENVVKICDSYGIHILTAEDIFSGNHPPKIEFHDNYTLFIFRLFDINNASAGIIQFSIVLGNSFVLTFEHKQLSIIEEYYSHVKNKNNRDCFTITYELLDTIVDYYLECAYSHQNKLDEIAESLIGADDDYKLNDLFAIKKFISLYRRSVRPIIDIIDKSITQGTLSNMKDSKLYLRNLLDHSTRVSLLADNMWENVNIIQNEMLTHYQYKLSKTMTMMTAVSIIFLPLMFITGIYGMNFDYMPELHYKYSYPLVIFFMVVIAVFLGRFFIKKKLM